ncbi:lysine transporter LysM [Vibrio sp. SM6]|uniref:Lysine transporter LysM n=1 Tax=Vibrio agarilyticus TaxID=2726741 RepID=A0A7X8TP92_9VIBR|nr:LysM-like peptidoglycan-binding domain-containing protein [Vibrio agarilyticus]NLS12432.1 lysine transporter LysM [Vibrio agarilyticus]
MNRRRKRTAKLTLWQQFMLRLQQHKLSMDAIRGISFASFKTKWSQTQVTQLWQRLPKLHQRLVFVSLLVIVALVLMPSSPELAQPLQTEKQRIPLAVNTTGLSEQSVAAPQKAVLPQRSAATDWHEYTVRQGDTLAQVFRANQLPMQDLNALVKIEGGDKPLSHIRQGQMVRFKRTEGGELDILKLTRGNDEVTFFRASDGGFKRNR